MENFTVYVQQNEINRQEGQPITAVLRQAGFRASFDAFCVYLSSVLHIKCSAKIPPERKAANRYPQARFSRISERFRTLTIEFNCVILLQEGIEMKSTAIHTSPDIMSGTPVFRGTRVPIKNLFDYLESGDTIENFLSDFPTVKREQVIEVLELAEHALTSNEPVE